MVRKRLAGMLLIGMAMLSLVSCVHLGRIAPTRSSVWEDNTEMLHASSSTRGPVGGADSTVFTVVIDPGHGGRDTGAISASGRYEKDFTLSLARKVMDLLEQEPHIQVYLTRTDDEFISQLSMYRTDYAHQVNADLLISLHGNTYSDPNVSGTETLYYHADSRRLAQIVQRHVAAATGFRDRGIKRKNLFVVREATMPAVLIEVGYLTNPRDEMQMWNDDFQRRVAAAIVEGIKAYQREVEQWR